MRLVSNAVRSACLSSGVGAGRWVALGTSCLSRCRSFEGESEARWDGRSEVVRTASTSYFVRASLGERGRPDHITSSLSSGGMKSVRVDVGIWYVREQSGRGTPDR